MRKGKVTNVVVTSTSGNVEVDGVAANFMRERTFLPAVNERGEAMESLVRVTVNMFKRGGKNVARVTTKPPPMGLEKDRVQRMTCADFLWEVERMHQDANIKDTSFEQTPYISAMLYKEKRHVPIDVEHVLGHVDGHAREGRESLREAADAPVLHRRADADAGRHPARAGDGHRLLAVRFR